MPSQKVETTLHTRLKNTRSYTANGRNAALISTARDKKQRVHLYIHIYILDIVLFTHAHAHTHTHTHTVG